MTKTIDLQVNAKNIADIKKGYPLILKEAIINPNVLTEEGSIIRLVDRRPTFCGERLLWQSKQRDWLGVDTRKRTKKSTSTSSNQKLRRHLNDEKPFLQIQIRRLFVCLTEKAMALVD